MEQEKFDIGFSSLAKCLNDLWSCQTNVIAALDCRSNPKLTELIRLVNGSLKSVVTSLHLKMEPCYKVIMLQICEKIDENTPQDESEKGGPIDVKKCGSGGTPSVDGKFLMVKRGKVKPPSTELHLDDEKIDDLFTLNIDEGDLNNMSPKVLDAPLGNLVRSLVSEDRHDEAIKLCEDSIRKIQRVTKTKESLPISIALYILASVFSSKGDYKEAVVRLNKVIEMRKKIFGNDHFSIAGILNNLAVVHATYENYEEAEPLCQRSHNIYVKYIKDHVMPTIARQIYNKGALEQNQGNYMNAEVHYREIVGSNKYRPTEICVKRSEDNLAICLRKQAKSKKVDAPIPSSSNRKKK